MDVLTLALFLAVVALIVVTVSRGAPPVIYADPTVRALLVVVVLLVLIWAALHLPDRPLFK